MGMFRVELMDEISFFFNKHFGPQNPPVITWKIVYKCANFMVAVLYLPVGAAMPLHDLPGTTLFSKLLVGSAHIEAYDWVRPRVCAAVSGSGSATLAKKVADQHVTVPRGTWVLLPDSTGNVRRLVAGQKGPCALLNVLAPLHSSPEHRFCAFYQDLPYGGYPNAMSAEATEEQMSRLAWLRRIDEPKDFKVFNLPYRGPPIV